MRLVRIGLLAMFAWPLAANAASDPWRVTESKDATTDEVRRTAIVSNEGGFTFSVYTVASKSVWANFTIPESDSALLDGQKLIVYQVDDYPPQTQDSNRFGERAMHMHLIDAQPKWVSWVIGARGSSGLQQTLRQLQGGQRLIVRFYLNTGGSRDTEFTLAGAREALAEVAGVPATWDVADEQRSKEQLKEQLKRRPLIRAAAAGASHRCKDRFSVERMLEACFERESNCTRKYGDDPISPEAAAALIACYDGVRP